LLAKLNSARAINLNTAKAIGLTTPLLARADEVIE
jgi:hypothetical protein